MVALVVSTLLVAMVLQVYLRLSTAYRGPQQLSELQQVLQAAQTMVVQDLRQAGYGMPQGFRFANDGNDKVRAAIQVINSATAPDELRVYYADPSSLTVVRSPALSRATTVD